MAFAVLLTMAFLFLLLIDVFIPITAIMSSTPSTKTIAACTKILKPLLESIFKAFLSWYVVTFKNSTVTEQ